MNSPRGPGAKIVGERGRRAKVRAHGPAFVSARWLAMVVAALLSLTVQSFVAQTHLHLGPRATSGEALHSTGLMAPLPPRHRSEPLDCPACRQLARAASVMLPPAIGLVVPIMAPSWFGRFRLGPLCDAQRSHRWRSRGPPPGPAV